MSQRELENGRLSLPIRFPFREEWIPRRASVPLVYNSAMLLDSLLRGDYTDAYAALGAIRVSGLAELFVLLHPPYFLLTDDDRGAFWICFTVLGLVSS